MKADSSCLLDNPKKPTNRPENSADSDSLSQENDYQLTYELMWCVQQMDGLRTSPKTTEKQAFEVRKAMKSLLNDKTPLIKKRQLMRLYCGDYRKKMAEDDEKQRQALPCLARQPSIPSSSHCFRKATSVSREPLNDDGALSSSINSLGLDSHNSPSITEESSPGECDSRTTIRSSSSVANLFKNRSNNSFSFNFDLAVGN
ncbi:UPF0488 protein C8orf33 homolog isoform X2 [Hyalella azteca]|nr:UPF0488 protein C8orf33 homolog isoform X2 [Hyalella azteca]